MNRMVNSNHHIIACKANCSMKYQLYCLSGRGKNHDFVITIIFITIIIIARAESQSEPTYLRYCKLRIHLRLDV